MQVLGLLNLDPARFGLAQVDVDGAMHKAITSAEIHNNPDPGRSVLPADPDPAPNPEVFDPEATLPSMRSGGLQLYIDGRGATTVDAIQQSKAFNQALESGGAQPRPFYAEDLVRGYRLDVWESRTNAWHSLHRRSGHYLIGDGKCPSTPRTRKDSSSSRRRSPRRAPEPTRTSTCTKSIARWAGWSLSVPFPGKSLSRYGDPDKAIPPDGDDPEYRTDEALTAFKVRATYKVVKGTLPRLRFGSRYRIRARAVDLAGNSMRVDDPIGDTLALLMALPRDPEGQAYLRYEPVAAPLVVIRDEEAVTSPGSAIHRLVMRTFNDGPANDTLAADLDGQRSSRRAAAYERRTGRAHEHVRRSGRQAEERRRHLEPGGRAGRGPSEPGHVRDRRQDRRGRAHRAGHVDRRAPLPARPACRAAPRCGICPGRPPRQSGVPRPTIRPPVRSPTPR